jgi:hypothetical protein
MRKLDRKKDYATIHGDLEGKHYEQGGVTFDAAGNEWGVSEQDAAAAEAAAEAEANAKEAADRAALEARVKAEVAAKLAAAGLGPDGKPLKKAAAGSEAPAPKA